MIAAARPLIEKYDPVTLGVGSPGSIDSAAGVVLRAGNLPFRNVPLAQELEQALGIPTSLENDANCALIAEAPKIMPFVAQMKETLAPILGVSPKRVGVKATTNEKLGALGRREGMAAFATVSIQLPEE
jgi:2C-methyl-D-erythritol 2,4-cyclodiphosphate synthase